MNRKKFLQTACPLIGLGAVDLSFIVSCTKENPTEPVPEAIPVEEQEYLTIMEQIGTQSGIEIDDSLYLNLSHSKYEPLENVDAFINDLEERLLLLRKAVDTVLAFDNCCPHRGTRNQWTYNNNRFKCNNHGNSFGTSTGSTAFCNSNSNGGNLLQYGTALYKDLLKITFG